MLDKKIIISLILIDNREMKMRRDLTPNFHIGLDFSMLSHTHRERERER